MPLTFDFSRVKKYKGNIDKAYVEVEEFGSKFQDVEPIMKSLIFFGGLVGLSKITYGNVSEWYARLKVCEKYLNTYTHQKLNHETGEYVDGEMTKDLLVEYIGLSTNHSSYSRSEWISRMTRDGGFSRIDITKSALEKEIKKLVEEFEYGNE
jgi:hypothetical protein